MKPRAVKNSGENGGLAPVPVFDFDRFHQILQPDNFFAFWRSHPHPERILVYAYRLQPIIDRKLTNQKGVHIATYPEPIDEQKILEEFGSGKYHLKLTDSTHRKGQGELARTTFRIDDPSAPPILDPRELVVSCPENQQYVQRYLTDGWVIEDDKLVRPSSKPPADPNSVLAETVSTLAMRQSAGSPAPPPLDHQLVQMAVETITRERPKDGLEIALQVLDKIRTPPPSESVTSQILLKILDKQLASPPDPFEQFAKVRDLIERPAASTWIDVLPAVASSIGQAIGAALAARQGIPVASPPPVPVATASETTIGNGNGENVGIPLKSLADALNLGKDALAAYDRGVSGDEFAAALDCGREQDSALYNYVAGLGVDELLRWLKMSPGIAERLEREGERIRAWLTDFCEFANGDPEPDEEEMPETPIPVPVPIPPPVAAKKTIRLPNGKFAKTEARA